jgi:hypothetical protein
MDEEEAIIAGDQLTVVRQWLDYMDSCDLAETLSYEEITEIQNVYDLIKHAIY